MKNVKWSYVSHRYHMYHIIASCHKQNDKWQRIFVNLSIYVWQYMLNMWICDTYGMCLHTTKARYDISQRQDIGNISGLTHVRRCFGASLLTLITLQRHTFLQRFPNNALSRSSGRWHRWNRYACKIYTCTSCSVTKIMNP